MKKLISITLLLLLITPCLRAQKKEMSQARSYIKSGKDLDKAEKLMAELLAGDSANRLNPKIYLLQYQAIKRQYEAGNEKLYLKQSYDTAAFFDLTRRMFTVLESLDSIDVIPDKKGIVKPVYRQKHSQELDLLRPNLYYGGTYHVTKSKFGTAFVFFDIYIDCIRQPLFSEYNYRETDTRIVNAAYWATYCGYKEQNPDNTLKYAELALADTSKLIYTLRYMAEAYRLSGNTERYLSVLNRGFDKYPGSSYFFPHLMDFYTQQNRFDSALAVADRALRTDGRNELFLLAKSSVLLNTGRYEECIALSDSLIHINDTLPDAYLNAGTACMNLVLRMEEGQNSRRNKQQMQKLYKQAMPYMEKYRELAPEEKQKWASPLYKIYLNLNLGRQFEEIDKILNEK